MSWEGRGAGCRGGCEAWLSPWVSRRDPAGNRELSQPSQLESRSQILVLKGAELSRILRESKGCQRHSQFEAQSCKEPVGQPWRVCALSTKPPPPFFLFF